MDNGMEGLIVTLFIYAILGLIPAFIASGKGRSFGLWYFYGFMFFIIALIHSLVIAKRKPEDAEARVEMSAVSR